ncbi:MAG: tripartite tricarboxylate transporter TctB family protein [Bacillota bacterium]
MMRPFGDLFVGLVAVGLGLFEAVSGMQMEEFGNPESAGTFPFAAGLATVVLGGVLIAQWVLAWRRLRTRPLEVPKANPGSSKVEASSLFIVLVLLGGFALLLPTFHFKGAGFVFLLSFMLALGGYRRPVTAFAVAAVTIVTVAQVFTRVFRLVLP